MRQPSHYDPGTGNVFADLHLPNPEDLLARANLVTRIDRVVRRRNLSQKAAAAILGITPRAFSRLQRTDFHAYSTEKLRSYLRALEGETASCTTPHDPDRPIVNR